MSRYKLRVLAVGTSTLLLEKIVDGPAPADGDLLELRALARSDASADTVSLHKVERRMVSLEYFQEFTTAESVVTVWVSTLDGPGQG